MTAPTPDYPVSKTCCVIFNLDGPLADSERLNNQAFLDRLPELDLSVEQLTHRHADRHLASILEALTNALRRPLPENFKKTYRQRVMPYTPDTASPGWK